MNKNTWIIWAAILMVPGAIGLGYHFAQRNAMQDRISQAAEATARNAATDEYLDMYRQWVQLVPKEKSENPWGQDPYGGQAIQKRLLEGQSDRLLADLPDLDQGVKHYPEELAETLYGFGWQQAVEDYRRQCSKDDTILIGSVFLLAGSGLILIGGLGKMLVMYILSPLKRLKTDDSEVEAQAEDDKKSADQPSKPLVETPDPHHVPFMEMQPVSDAEKLVTVNRTNKQPEEGSDNEDAPGYFESRKKAAQKTPADSQPVKGSLTELSKSLSPSLCIADKPTEDSYFGWALREGEQSSLETLMTPEPLTKELTELTEEVSAIRQFAAQQQDQVRKLQDGYDWMIIRRFCMRIIRSIDNIEDRIARQDDPDSEAAICLGDIRDELVFALESSGIEQFNPEINMPYKGLEKYAEAVRQRIPTDDESLGGCIGQIVRPGYQYLISDDDVKIVRCAQVKLYDGK